MELPASWMDLLDATTVFPAEYRWNKVAAFICCLHIWCRAHYKVAAVRQEYKQATHASTTPTSFLVARLQFRPWLLA